MVFGTCIPAGIVALDTEPDISVMPEVNHDDCTDDRATAL